MTAADRRNKGDSVIEEPSARRVKPPPRALIELSNRKTFSFTLRLSDKTFKGDRSRNMWVNSTMLFSLLPTFFFSHFRKKTNNQPADILKFRIHVTSRAYLAGLATARS